MLSRTARGSSAWILATVLAPSASPQGFFEEAAPLMELSGIPGFSDRQAYVDPVEGVTTFYAPPDVTVPHANHVITRFYPTDPKTGTPVDPDETDRFPTLVYSANFGFSDTPPGQIGFQLLRKALDMGWMVITVGSVGANSDPTCAQPDVCLAPGTHPCPSCGPFPCPPPDPCWDPGLWYEPIPDVSSPWYDFNYFYGEKDMAWAVQFVTHDALNANTLNVDPERIVVCGTSGGAVYASFAGHADPRWELSVDPTLSAQAQEPLSVDAVVLLDPIGWSQALPPSFAPVNGTSGAHWPDDANPRSRTPNPTMPTETGGLEHVMPVETLNTQSASRWIREEALQVPTFIASGDGSFLTTGFGRNGSTTATPPEGPVDYDRATGTPAMQDPLFDVTLPTEPAHRIHDARHPLDLMRDLLIADPIFHAGHSELWLREDLDDWQNFPNVPPFMPAGSMPLLGGATPDVGSLLLVEGLFGAYDDYVPDPPGTLMAPACNLALSREVFAWLDEELEPGVEKRVCSPNVDALAATTARMGEDLEIVVDLNVVPSPYDGAAILAYLKPGKIPYAQGGLVQWILVSFDEADNANLGLGLKLADASGLVTYSVPVARDPSLVGLTLYLQACIYDPIPNPGGSPILLSHSQDVTLLEGFIPDYPFINEIHYFEKDGNDAEFIEIAAAEDTSLIGYDLHVYDDVGFLFTVDNIGLQTEPAVGQEGKGRVPAQGGSEFGTLILEVAGLPNAVGGLALTDPNGNLVGFDTALAPGSEEPVLVEFLSWGGTITAKGGPADTLVSTDVGVTETGTSDTDSLQRTGSAPGAFSLHFPTWVGPATETPGGINSGSPPV